MGVREVQWPGLPYKCIVTFTKATKKEYPLTFYCIKKVQIFNRALKCVKSSTIYLIEEKND